MAKVGIPRALSYYRYFPMWKTLLEYMGAEVVVSSPTGKRLLENGIMRCVDDICVPVKLYYGHALDLKDKVDYLFVQRLITIENGEYDSYTCPKLIGLPDMIRSSLPELPPVLEFSVDVKRYPLERTVKKLAKALPTRKTRPTKALEEALRVQHKYEDRLLEGMLPEDALDSVLRPGSNGNGKHREKGTGGAGDVNIAIIGHEYLVHDPYISHNLPEKLEELGANLFYSSQVPERVINGELAKYPDISWSFEKELLGSASYFLGCEDIHGVLLVICFACGPDSIIGEIISREVLSEESPPLMSLVLDEHTGEAGVATRIEAFIDMIRRSQKK